MLSDLHVIKPTINTDGTTHIAHSEMVSGRAVTYSQCKICDQPIKNYGEGWYHAPQVRSTPA